MKELIRRAILGTNIQDLASNIAEIGLSPIVCNRIICGCVKEKSIDMDKIYAYINDESAKDVSISITDNQRDASLTVKYKTLATRFVKSETVVEDKIYDENEMFNKFETRYAKNEEYSIPIKYYNEHELTLIPEEFV